MSPKCVDIREQKSYNIIAFHLQSWYNHFMKQNYFALIPAMVVTGVSLCAGVVVKK